MEHIRESIRALDETLKIVNKQIHKIEKDLEQVKANADSYIKPCVVYKGDPYYSYDELQEAYGCDAFNMTTFDKLAKQLQDTIDAFEPNIRTCTLEFELKYWKHFRKELDDTKSINEGLIQQ